LIENIIGTLQNIRTLENVDFCEHRSSSDGNMNGVACKKPYLDATLEALVMQNIKYGAKA